ncbi:MAG: site-2 protease family protein [Propionibacteriaceae bacterium]|jgi:membrane-associated protease RseP (regulator of RpoE activity)|nr:site-2 protease family protein [Propionibacteriaceae bacterium]
MDWLGTIVYALIFFTLIMLSVALHEVGHMVPAKLFGVKVPRYFVGFGPTIFSRKIGETEYGLKAFPLGGFVSLLGMYPPGSKRYGKPSRLMEFADAARAQEWEDISDQDVIDERLVYQKKTWQKVVIMFGGPLMNILIAFMLFWGITAGYGVWRAQPVISAVQDCVKTSSDTSTTCTDADPATPAAQAGVRPGDRIVEFNQVPITDYAQLTELIRANLDQAANIVVERDGARLELATVHTMINQVADEWDPTATVSAGFLGVVPTQELVKGGPVQALGDMWTMTKQSAVALAKFPVSVYYVAADMVTGQPRSISSPMSIVGASWIAGEVVTAEGVAPEARVMMFASLLGSINLFLAIFNLVPLPPLDGGHIAGALYEWLRRKVAALRGKLDPGPFDTAKLLPVAYGMWAFLLLCGIVLIVADVVNPLRLF